MKNNLNDSRSELDNEIEKLAQDQKNKPKRILFRNHYESIEKALDSGTSHNDIILLLKKYDFEISHSLFRKYLFEERKRRNLSKEKIPESFTAPSKLESFRMSEVVPKNSVISNSSKEKSELETEPAKEWKSAYSKNDPRAIDEALSRKIDLDALAKAYKEKLRKGEV